MAIRAKADDTVLQLINQPSITPPLVFKDWNPFPGASQDFSFSIWVYVENSAVSTQPLVEIIGDDNISGFSLFYTVATITNNARWVIRISVNGQPDVTVDVQSVLELTWHVLCFTKQANNFTVYDAAEFIPNATTDLVLTQTIPFTVSNQNFRFGKLNVRTSHTVSICNFKYWNTFLTVTDFQNQALRWGLDGTGPTPIWASPLRTGGVQGTPGNTYSIVNQVSYPNQIEWISHNSWYHIIPSDFNIETFLPDPLYMATNTKCLAWIEVTVGGGVIAPINPGSTLTTDATYKSPTFITFFNDGVIPKNTTILDAIYFGFPSFFGTGVRQTSTWPLVKDEFGTEIAINFGDPTNRFEQDTSVIIPGFTSGALTMANLYLYQYGGQYTWAGTPTPVPTATATLGGSRLLITFKGLVTGLSYVSTPGNPPGGATAGLFKITKGKLEDTYHSGTVLKIPNPTIRTAFIGE